MLDSIKRYFDKFRGGDSTLGQSTFGRFRVTYPDGNKTIPMYWNCALSYAEIGKGEVHHIRTNKLMKSFK